MVDTKLGEVDSPVGVLRCSVGAARKVNSAFGGFSKLFRALVEYDLEAYITLAAAGLGKRPGDVAESVYVEGMQSLVGPFSEYAGLLANGGKPATTEEDTPKTGEG